MNVFRGPFTSYKIYIVSANIGGKKECDQKLCI